ncbi:MAG: ATP synthase F1 subunit gamma [Candidatus Curtissbacteria bacterium]|nr:ATP synthase F1 subunit gamma [Candidatus Curtissbacteria bacterium]
MTQIREIKRRIKSIENTSKVTHAMELVSAAKMRKAQEKTVSSRPYTSALHQMIIELRPETHKNLHRLLKENSSPNQLVILITSDRGFVGGLNLNLAREAIKMTNKNTKFIVVGKKALSFAVKMGADVIAGFQSEEKPFIDLARTIAKMAVDAFTKAEVSGVYLIYSKFESTIKQVPTVQKLLPITLTGAEAGIETEEVPQMLFEPSADRIIERLLPHHVLTHIYQILLESKASEHSARMVAMKNATDAASDLVDDLTLTYNQARQESITKELLDIITAQAVFE